MGLASLLRVIRGDAQAPEARRYWVFYAGPENYLDEGGLRELPEEVFWSCEPETSRGDLILLYRRSMKSLSIADLVSNFGMRPNVAADVKKMGIGKDFPLVWEAASDAKRVPSWHWPYGCDVKKVRRISPPILLEELKAEPRLTKWNGLRWNLQARGQSALEIPESVWKIIVGMIEDPTSRRRASSSTPAEP